MRVNVCERTQQECSLLWMDGIGHTLRAETASGSLSCPKMCHELTKVGKSCSGEAKLPSYNEVSDHSRGHSNIVGGHLTEAEHITLGLPYIFLLSFSKSRGGDQYYPGFT